MKQQNLYLPFLDIKISKDTEANNIWIDKFYKKTNTRRCVPTLVTPSNAKIIIGTKHQKSKKGRLTLDLNSFECLNHSNVTFGMLY